MPGVLPAGSYSLVAIVDDLDSVAESNESNNDLADAQPIELIDCDNPGLELCTDQIDNDCDGFVDGADTDCQAACFPRGTSCTINSDCCSLKCRGTGNRICKGNPVCTVSENPEVSCGDGQDNDCDGLIDLDDLDCQGPCIPDEIPEETCGRRPGQTIATASLTRMTRIARSAAPFEATPARQTATAARTSAGDGRVQDHVGSLLRARST